MSGPLLVSIILSQCILTHIWLLLVPARPTLTNCGLDVGRDGKRMRFLLGFLQLEFVLSAVDNIPLCRVHRVGNK